MKSQVSSENLQVSPSETAHFGASAARAGSTTPALLDAVTGLPNRHMFEEMLWCETRRAARVRHPVSVLLVAVDAAEQLSRHWGPQSLEDVMRRIGSSLEHFFRRAGDFAARYGRSSFSVILPSTNTEESRRLANRLVQIIHAQGINCGHQQVTVSVGLATNRMNWDLGGEALTVVASHALSCALAAGGNRVAESRGC